MSIFIIRFIGRQGRAVDCEISGATALEALHLFRCSVALLRRDGAMPHGSGAPIAIFDASWRDGIDGTPPASPPAGTYLHLVD